MVLVLILNSCEESDKNKRKSFIHPVKKKYLSQEKLQADFKQLDSILKENHPTPFEYINRDTFNTFIKSKYNEITDSLSEVDFYNICCEVTAKIGCGHTFAYKQWDDSLAKLLPLNIKFIEGKAYIVDNFSNKPFLNPKTEVLKINGVKILDIYDNLLLHISSDGYNTSRRKSKINSYFSYFYALHYGFFNNFHIEYKHNDSSQIKKTSIYSVDAKKYFDNIEQSFSKLDSEYCFELDPEITVSSFLQSSSDYKFELCPDISTGIMTIKSFAFYDQQSRCKFEGFIEKCFMEIEKEEIKSLVIDLRNNGGGNPYSCSFLLSYLIKKPTKYFSEGYVNLKNYVQPHKIAYKGNVYILINGACFSSTGHLCSILKYNDIGKFVGQETGSTYRCTDGSRDFTLNNSKLIIRVARGVYITAVNGLRANRGIIPDYEIDISLDTYVKENDTIKQYVFQLINDS